MYLLTDGDFPDNDAVKTDVQRLSRDKKTKINTILFVPGDGGTEASKSFVELMKQIAKDNGGVFSHVEENELQ